MPKEKYKKYDEFDLSNDDYFYKSKDDLKFAQLDEGVSHSGVSHSAKPDEVMPPRNVLESDSAKYTAEYIKEVVKDLYSTDTHAYVDSKGDAVYKPVHEGADIKGTDEEAEISDLFTRQNPHDAEGEYFYKEPQPEAKDENINSEEAAAFYDEQPWQAPSFIKKREMTIDDSEQAQQSFDRESFFREYEERMNREKNTHDKQLKERKPAFNNMVEDEDTGRMERVLSGRGGNRHAFSDEEYIYAKDLAGYDGKSVRHAEPEKADYRKQEYSRARAVAEEDMEQERIPLVINKNIVSKPRRPATEHKAPPQRAPRTKLQPEPPQKRNYAEYDNDDSGRGLNIFAVVFMAVSVIVIGFLVYRVNVLSKEVAAGGSEQIIVLEETIERLTGENDRLNERVAEMSDEIERLTSINDSESVSEQTADSGDGASAQQDEDQYYTVQRGDSLYKIARDHMGDGNLYPKLAEANNIDPARDLVTGTKLIIPK